MLGLSLGLSTHRNRSGHDYGPPGGAALFDRTQAQALRASDNDLLSFSGDQDFWLSFWLYLTTGFKQAIIGKMNASGTQEEWGVWYNRTGAPVLDFYVGAGGVGETAVSGALAEPLNAWHHVFCVHYSNGLLISMDAVSYVFASWTNGVLNGANPFCIGGLADAESDHVSGRVDAVCFGATPSEWGDLGSNCTPIRDSLYNAGTGKPYAGLTAQEKSDWGLRCFFDLNEEQGNYRDRHRKVLMANINGVTRGEGKV